MTNQDKVLAMDVYWEVMVQLDELEPIFGGESDDPKSKAFRKVYSTVSKAYEEVKDDTQ